MKWLYPHYPVWFNPPKATAPRLQGLAPFFPSKALRTWLVNGQDHGHARARQLIQRLPGARTVAPESHGARAGQVGDECGIVISWVMN